MAVAQPAMTRRSARNVRGVVFDLDDTLTTAEFKDEMWARTIEHIRAVLSEVDGEQVRHRASAMRDVHYSEVLAGTIDLDGFRRRQLAHAVAPWGELPEATVCLCLRERDANLERRRLTAGAKQLIDRLRAAGMRVGVLTNGPSELQRRKLAGTGLERLLDAVAISGEIGISKPRAGAYRHAAALLGCQPQQTAMVGDQLECDVAGALRAGYRLAILVGGRPAALPRDAVQVQALDEVFSRLVAA